MEPSDNASALNLVSRKSGQSAHQISKKDRSRSGYVQVAFQLKMSVDQDIV